MDTQSFTFHTDPGHGWLEVSKSQLETVGLGVDQISGYSYRNGDTLYLEEDCDAGLFLARYKVKYGKLPECLDRYAEDSFVRNLPHV